MPFLVYTIGKWLSIIGPVVAILAALFGFSAEWLTLVLMSTGILVGLWAAPKESLTNAVIRYLGLTFVASALNNFIVVGSFISAIANAVVGFLGSVLLTALIVWYFNDLRE